MQYFTYDGCANNHHEITKILISHGIEVNAADNKGKTALMIAVNNKNLYLVKVLVKSGADPYQKDINNQFSAYDLASRTGYEEVKEILDNSIYFKKEVEKNL